MSLQFAIDYSLLKSAMSEYTGASEPLLHVHFGLLIFVATALVLKRRMRSPWPLGVVVFFALANEAVDFLSWGKWNPDTSALDVVNTVVWPFVLFLLARRAQPERGSAGSDAEPALPGPSATQLLSAHEKAPGS